MCHGFPGLRELEILTVLFDDFFCFVNYCINGELFKVAGEHIVFKKTSSLNCGSLCILLY